MKEHHPYFVPEMTCFAMRLGITVRLSLCLANSLFTSSHSSAHRQGQKKRWGEYLSVFVKLFLFPVQLLFSFSHTAHHATIPLPPHPSHSHSLLHAPLPSLPSHTHTYISLVPHRHCSRGARKRPARGAGAPSPLAL